jgi:hypothetical protein
MAESQARPQAGQCEICGTQSVVETKCGFYRQMFIELPNIKFYENPSSRSNADTCRETDGRTDVKKLKALFATNRVRLKIADVTDERSCHIDAFVVYLCRVFFYFHSCGKLATRKVCLVIKRLTVTLNSGSYCSNTLQSTCAVYAKSSRSVSCVAGCTLLRNYVTDRRTPRLHRQNSNVIYEAPFPFLIYLMHSLLICSNKS